MTTKIAVLCTLIFLFTGFYGKSFAQSTAYCQPDDCLFWAAQPEEIDSAVITYAQNLWSIDEWDNAFGCGFFNQCENLNMLVYYPKLTPAEKRPLVLLIHGGGFISGDYTAFQATAKALAQLGYVTATINYRLCKRNNCLIIANTGCSNLCNASFTSDFLTSSYVAAVDANTAIRYLQQNAATYHIDPENIIVGGHSAGAWTAMNVAFMDQSEANAMNAGWQGAWGDLNPVSGIRGVLCLSGLLPDTNLIDASEKRAVFVLHGTCDPTACYDSDAIFHCNSSYPKVFGGKRIAERLHNLGQSYYLFSGLGMGHDITPLLGTWSTEMLRFMKSAMLCAAPIRKHAMATLSPGSSECTLLTSDIPGCDLQHNHAQLPSSNLPVSAVWGEFPAPCGTGTVATLEPDQKAALSVRPTLVEDHIMIEIKGETTFAQVSVLNAQGQVIQHIQIQNGATQRVDMQALASGIYFIRYRTSGDDVGAVKVIKR